MSHEPPWCRGRASLLHALTRRRGLPFAVLRVDRQLVALNGTRLRTPGVPRRTPEAVICAVAYHAELRPTARELIAHLLDPAATVLPRSRVLGQASVAAAEAQAAADTRFAVESAVAAAARYLGRRVRVAGRGVRVDAVQDPQPVRPGERIVAVGRVAVRTLDDLLPLLDRSDTVDVTVQAGLPGVDPSRSERLARRDDGRWGLRVSTDQLWLRSDLDVTVDLPADLGGASLGLGCALGVVDALTGGSLSRHGHVAATGAVTHDGRIGEVSGLELKARAVGAHPEIGVFLVPPTPEPALASLRALGRAAVIPVARLDEAVAALERHWSGEGGVSHVVGRQQMDRRPLVGQPLVGQPLDGQPLDG